MKLRLKTAIARSVARSSLLQRLLLLILVPVEGLLRKAAILTSDVPEAGRLHVPTSRQLAYLHDVRGARARIDEATALLRPVPFVAAPLVRVGSNEDGGYDMVDDLGGDDFFLSFGVGPDVSWDQAVGPIGRGVHMYDHTVTETPGHVPNGRHFPERITGGPDDGGTTLAQCLSRAPQANDHILKMDIEGSEWAVLAQAESVTLAKFRQIVVELHGLPDLADRQRAAVMLAGLRNLAKTHAPVRLHANNWRGYMVVANVPLPEVVEATFVRRADYEVPASSSATPASRANDPNFPDIVLCFP